MALRLVCRGSPDGLVVWTRTFTSCKSLLLTFLLFSVTAVFIISLKKKRKLIIYMLDADTWHYITGRMLSLGRICLNHDNIEEHITSSVNTYTQYVCFDKIKSRLALIHRLLWKLFFIKYCSEFDIFSFFDHPGRKNDLLEYKQLKYTPVCVNGTLGAQSSVCAFTYVSTII